jgi:hypothetical protein
LRALVPLALSLVVGSCGRGSSSTPTDSVLQIALRPAASRVLPAYVEVTGLRADELAALRTRQPTDAAWPSLFSVTTGADAPTQGAPVIEGRYAATDTGVRFTPLFPFDPGRPYRVTFDPSRLPRPRGSGAIASVVALPAIATKPTTVVTAVYPGAGVLPENLLRVYIEFSAPMGSGVGLDFVKLVELSGPGDKTERVEEGAFLPVDASFWSPDHTRYTLFFDPGRVKEGILPNRQRGRPLRAGHHYALDISARWADGNGLPLASGYRHVFRAGPAVLEPIRLSDWKIVPPAANTIDRLVVTFPRPLDHGILVRALGVETRDQHAVGGEITLEADDTRLVFAPTSPWQGGDYNLTALSFLEDPQGNQIGRAFEVYSQELKDNAVPDTFRVAFTIAGRRP